MTDERKPGLQELLGDLGKRPETPLHRRASWERLSAEYRRRNPYCEAPGCGLPASHTDHIRSVVEAPHLAEDASNLQSLCRGHHSQKTASVDGGWGHARKPGEVFTFKPLRLSSACDAN